MNELTPSQYFDSIKESQTKITLQELKDSFSIFLQLAEKYKKLGQVKSLQRLNFLAKTLEKEEKLVELGITTFVYRSVLEEIDNVDDDVVKIIELKNYLREIPDELVEIIEKTKDIFDEFYIVFTDYTGKEERRVEQERRDRDPILFGCFKTNNYVADRFYVIGDWVDEYCDLTLDKLVTAYQKDHKYSPVNDVTIPQTISELKKLLADYEPDMHSSNSINHFVVNPINHSSNKKSILSNIRKFFKK